MSMRILWISLAALPYFKVKFCGKAIRDRYWLVGAEITLYLINLSVFAWILFP